MVLVSCWERPREDSAHLVSGLTVETEAAEGRAVGSRLLCPVLWFLPRPRQETEPLVEERTLPGFVALSHGVRTAAMVETT